MTMSYRRRNKKIFFIVIALIVILLLGFLNIAWPQTLVKNSSGAILNVKNFFSQPFKNLSTSFKDKKELENKIALLEDELLKTQILLLSKESGGNIISKEENQFKVLSRPPYSLYDTLLVNISDKAVNIGDLVFVDNIFVGEVAEVESYTASVKMKSSSGEKTVVRISNVDAEAEGQGGGQFLVKIPKDLDVEIGDAVLIPSLNNILLGTVGSVEQDSAGTFQNIRFSIPISFQSIDFVEIVKIEDVLK